jgi:type I restriction-modification system DNA methylase subunit
MALKKSDLYSSLWQTCDALRGGMDASQYKDYVLTLLFVKYVSDKYAGRTDSLVVIPEGGGFADMVAAKGKADMGDRVNKIIAKLAEANGLKGVIDITDFNDDEKLGKDWWACSRTPPSTSAATAAMMTTCWAMPTSTSCGTSPPRAARARGSSLPRPR